MEMITNDIQVTSMQLAEMAKKKHSNILRTIREQFTQLKIDVSSFETHLDNIKSLEGF